MALAAVTVPAATRDQPICEAVMPLGPAQAQCALQRLSMHKLACRCTGPEFVRPPPPPPPLWQATNCKCSGWCFGRGTLTLQQGHDALPLSILHSRGDQRGCCPKQQPNRCDEARHLGAGGKDPATAHCRQGWRCLRGWLYCRLQPRGQVGFCLGLEALQHNSHSIFF
jgi:hypothetical protein